MPRDHSLVRWTIFLSVLALGSCGQRRELIAFAPLESEARQALAENHFDSYLAALGGDAAVRLSALMLSEDTFASAAWGLTQLTLRPGARVKSKWAASMMRPSSEDAEFSTGIEEAITALSMFYPEGMPEFVKMSGAVQVGTPWSETRTVAARLFGLVGMYHRERVLAGKPPINFDFIDIPGRTKYLDGPP